MSCMAYMHHDSSKLNARHLSPPDQARCACSKDAKLLRKMKFPAEYSLKVDMTEILGLEDEVVIGYIFEQLGPDKKVGQALTSCVSMYPVRKTWKPGHWWNVVHWSRHKRRGATDVHASERWVTWSGQLVLLRRSTVILLIHSWRESCYMLAGAGHDGLSQVAVQFRLA